jgi:hypothetical protein
MAAAPGRLLLGLGLSLASSSAGASVSSNGARRTTLLDGQWGFRLDQPPVNNQPASTQTGTIMVPGSWEAQGFGNETVQMHTQVVTGDRAKTTKGAVGTYTKSVTIAPCPNGAAAVFMVDQGIHRHAIFTIGGKKVGEHVGFMTPFETDITALLGPVEAPLEIEIALDGDRPCDGGGCPDAMIGAPEDDTDGTGLGGWAGLNGHVSIECQPKVYINGGVGNIVPPHVTHPPVVAASEGRPLEIAVRFLISGGSAIASVRILESHTGREVASSPLVTPPQIGNVTLKATIPSVKLWSPEERNLYTAVVSISIGPSEPVMVDSATTGFGVRTVAVVGHKLMLNGRRVYLAGYGDDAIYPMTVSPPRDKAEYEKKVQFAHEQ